MEREAIERIIHCAQDAGAICRQCNQLSICSELAQATTGSLARLSIDAL